MVKDEIVKLFNQYMGFTPTSDQISKFSLMDRAGVEDILKNTKSDVNSQATKGVNTAIESLKGSLGRAGTNYMSNLANFQQQAGQAYGLPQAEEQLQKSQKWANEIATKGPMFEQTMQGGLQGASPTFLGATRKSLEDYFANIPNPLVRDKMVGSYLSAADESMKANLNALNGLYKTVVTAALGASDLAKGTYDRISKQVQDLYSSFDWLMKDRLQEQQKDTWTNPYQDSMTGNIVQKNNSTGEIKTLSNTPQITNSGLLGQAFQSAVSDAPVSQVKYRSSVFQALVNSGDAEAAKEYILQTARETVPAGLQQVVMDRTTTIENLNSWKQALLDYQAAGGDTNIIRGSIENVANKIGKSTDTRLLNLKVIIEPLRMMYRRMMTGVQFGMKEDAQYRQIFGGISKDVSVNVAMTDALVKMLGDQEKSFYSQKIGGKAVYDQLFGEGSTVTGGVVDYSKTLDSLLNKP